MGNEETIEDMRKRINELATELNDYRQKLFALQQEMERLQNKKPGTTPVAKEPSQNFKFENFIGLRIIHFVGIVLLVIGLSIGVKYAIDRQLISEAMRIILAYSVGITLYLLSWKLKKKYQHSVPSCSAVQWLLSISLLMPHLCIMDFFLFHLPFY
jgi:uncharacterized membrane protein